jgi:hypothetical protein
MVRLQFTTEIAAPIERCFDLSRSIDLHVKSVEWSSEQAIAGVTTGLISSGEEVTWGARHFGVMLSHASRHRLRTPDLFSRRHDPRSISQFLPRPLFRDPWP